MSSCRRNEAGCATEFISFRSRIGRNNCSSLLPRFWRPDTAPRKNAMLHILLVDDHELIRAGLKQVLQAGLGKLIVGEAGNATDALDLVQKQTWSIAITDITL